LSADRNNLARWPIVYATTIISCLLLWLPGCSGLQKQPTATSDKLSLKTNIQLSAVANSPFKQVNVQFYSSQPKQLVFRVISDLSKTVDWFDNLASIETLQAYSNTEFLVRSVINSPWPFTARELITCVATDFSKHQTRIKISACSNRVAKDANLVRITQAESSWLIEEKSGLVKISYKAWIDPAGKVPIALFNQQLVYSTRKSIDKLRILIAKASPENYSY